ncbi:hypothetical protein [Panacagrimonas sp.]|uniref:hypothetical protein n=1 Tax=Panacagrimonas sp. TaxID=2480088 RepID=UPI003B51633E
MWAWGEAVRNGELERVLIASLASINEDGTSRSPGTHSDPTLARVIACDPITDPETLVRDAHLQAAMMVETEMQHWRKDRHQRFWTEVATAYYAGPHGRTNAEVGRLLKVSERTIEGVRSQMRRYLVMAARRV